MRRKLPIIVCLFWTCLSPFPSHAELAVGSEGKFKDTTEIASSQLHEGALANIQVFLGSIDRHNIELAGSYKGKIVSQLRDASGAYRNAAEYAGQKKINPVPSTEQDKQDVQYFFDHMKEFGFTEDLSEKNVTMSVQKLLVVMADKVASTDVKKLSSDIREQQKFFNYVLTVQFFLNSVTTVFRLG